MGPSDYSEPEAERPQTTGRVSYRFLKQDRLRKSSEFDRVYRRGRKIVSPNAVLFYSPNRLERFRFGITVSRKVGKAVQRNRIKRFLREAYRLNRQLLNRQQACDVVLVMRKEGAGLTFRELEKVLLELFSRAGLLDSDKNI